MIDLLRNVDMFEGLSDRQLKRLADICVERTLRKNDVLFYEGDQAHDLSLVKKGFVELLIKSAKTQEERVAVYIGQGQSVGEMSWLDRGLRSGTVQAAVDDTSVVSVSFQALDQLCEDNPKIGYRIMRNIATDLSFRLRQRLKTL